MNEPRMRITKDQYENAIKAAMTSTGAGHGAYPRYQAATSAILNSLGIEVVLMLEDVDDTCHCSPDVAQYCHSSVCRGGANLPIPDDVKMAMDEGDALAPCRPIGCDNGMHLAGCKFADLWVLRTWADVRLHDIVRPPGRDEHRAYVDAIGPVTGWHAAPNANQYRPNESPAEWSARRVTLTNVTRDAFTPDHGVKPDAAVEILTTQAEVDAIEACGGWPNRLDPT